MMLRFGRGLHGHFEDCVGLRSLVQSAAQKGPSGSVVGRSRTVLPRELGLDEATGGQGLHSLDDEQVLDGDLGVLGEVVVLLGDKDSLTEEGLPWKYLVSFKFHSRDCPKAVAKSTRP